MRARIAIALVAIAASAQAAPFLAGTWFGQGQPHDRSEMWIAHMQANGEFHAQFRRCTKGKASDTSNDGWWTLAGDTETIQISLVNGQFFPRSDVYQILKHDAKAQDYRYIKTGFVYHSTRVPDNFAMPGCDLTS